MHKLISIIVGCLLGCTTMAQSPDQGVLHSPVIPGPEGVFVYVADSANHGQKSSSEKSATIYKEEKPGRGFKKIAQLTFPASAAELEKRMGKDRLVNILQQRHIPSVEILYQQLRLGHFDTLGMYGTTPAIMEALGLLYIDRSQTTADPKVSYRLDVTSNGKIYTQYQIRLSDIRYSQLPRFRKYRSMINDSSALVTWYAVHDKAAFASIYSSAGSSTGIPEKVAVRQFVYMRKDTLFVTYSAFVAAGRRIVLYIHPEDLAGNTGPASDTVHLLSLRFSDRISISNLTARDTLGSVWLHWDSLPKKAWCSGIEILKSRFATADYVVIDTLSITATSYQDSKSLPGNVYYYQLRPLLYDLPQKGNITPSIVNITTKAMRRKMAAPQHLQISAAPGANIRLSWLPNADLDVFAYYILRGTSSSSLQVISTAVRDTSYVDSVKKMNTGITYLYAVVAMNMKMEWSDTSSTVAIQSPLAKLVTSPGGLQGRMSAQGVRLSWNDVSASDADVTGYILFRRKKGENYFTRLTATPIAGTHFVDSSDILPGVYEYGCSSVDAWNHVSFLSPVASVQVNGSIAGMPLYPPAGFVLRNGGSGIDILVPEIAWAAGEGKSEIPASARYNLYRRLVTEKTFRKIGELPISKTTYTDRQVVKDQLYSYVVTIQVDNTESGRTQEKSIRRK